MDLMYWLTYYKNNADKRTIWGNNEATIKWLTEQIADKRLHDGIICS